MKDQTRKNIEGEKPELGKRYQEIIEKKKNAATKKAATQAESGNAEAQAKNENAAAEANNENTEAEAEEVEGTCTGTMVNDGVETTREPSERHPGLHTVSEEAGHIVLHIEHVEHDMNDDTGERTKTMHNITNANEEQIEIVIENENAEAEAEENEGTSTETMLNDGVEATRGTGGTGEEHPELSTVNESSHIVGEEHHARCAHSDEEASSIVLHVSSDTNKKEKDDKEASETAEAKETEEISKDPKTHRGEKNHTQRRETALERSEEMHKNVSETKKE